MTKKRPTVTNTYHHGSVFFVVTGMEKHGQIKVKPRENEKNKNLIMPVMQLVMFFMIESLLFCHFHILVGIFHYRTWLVYSNDGLPQNCPRSS